MCVFMLIMFIPEPDGSKCLMNFKIHMKSFKDLNKKIMVGGSLALTLRKYTLTAEDKM